MDAQASSSAPLLTQEEEIIDYHDDATIRGYVPWVYVEGLGFDENRAALTIMGNMPLRPALIKALRKRINEEMSDRGTARFATSLDILISYPKKDGSGDTKENLPLTPAMIDAIRLGQDLNNQPAIAPAQTGSMLERANSNPPCDHLEPNMVNKVNNKPEPKQPNIPVRGDGEKWTEDKTKLLISLHAQRKSFKDISVSRAFLIRIHLSSTPTLRFEQFRDTNP